MWTRTEFVPKCVRPDVVDRLSCSNVCLIMIRIRLERATDVRDDHSRGQMLHETKAQLETLEEANLQMQMLIESLQQENNTLSHTTSQQVAYILFEFDWLCL